MDSSHISIFLALLIMGTQHVEAHHIKKLFVFGDSYADTGNLGKLDRSLTRCWYEPYGMTFPRYPTGRFSDGKILPDFLASFLGIRSPVPYKFRIRVSPDLLQDGMNFAVAGTGIFDLGNFQRNLSSQIDTFQGQIGANVYSKHDLKSSIALIAISGNDYDHFFQTHRNNSEIWGYIKNVTDQIRLEVKRIHDLGVKTVVAANLSPLGCTPFISKTYHYKHCDADKGAAVDAHNKNLEEAVEQLRRSERNGSRSDFLILDLHSAFMSIIKHENGTRKFENIFKPCCSGIKEGFDCGNVDNRGVKQYRLCGDPQNYLYWDSVHPTQSGWDAVFQYITPWLIKHLGKH